MDGDNESVAFTDGFGDLIIASPLHIGDATMKLFGDNSTIEDPVLGINDVSVIEEFDVVRSKGNGGSISPADKGDFILFVVANGFLFIIGITNG